MKTRIVACVCLSLVMASPAFAVRTILYYENECCRNITEGEFAILYCQGLKLREPAQGWTVQTAAAALSTLGHQPEGGWVLSRFLSEAVLSRLLRNTHFYRKPFTDPKIQTSDALVTISRARGIVPSDEGLTQGEFAILLAMALKLPIPAGCGPDTAIKTLMALAVPVKPVQGWKPSARLLESDMTQILISTPYRSTGIDPAMEIPALQAYSLLFGKYEVATQGHFGLFIVESLGAPPPAGGWTARTALDYIQKEFGVADQFGWNPGAPLCTETFENSLRQILNKIQQTPGAQPQPELMALWGRGYTGSSTSFGSRRAAFHPVSHGGTEFNQDPPPSARGRDVEALIREARRSGQIPADRCTTVPAQGLTRQSFNPQPPPPPPPPVSPTGPQRPAGEELF